MARQLWRLPVKYTTPEGESLTSVQYVFANDADEAAREAEANVYEENPGSDVFADPDLAIWAPTR